MKKRTTKQLEEWSFSTVNSDNINNKFGDETLVEQNPKKSRKNLEASSSDSLSTSCGSCCISKNIIESLKQDIQQLKTENNLRDKKINSLEEEIKKVAASRRSFYPNEAIGWGGFTGVSYANFVKIKNKWSEFDSECRFNKCNRNKPLGTCFRGNGYGTLINDENIKYVAGNRDFNDNIHHVYAENSFNKPQNCLNYSLYYFEIKCKFEGEAKRIIMNIGLKNCSSTRYISFDAEYFKIRNEFKGSFQVSPYSFNNNDIFGCVLVCPPNTKMNEEFPYVFFTKNGRQMGKGVKLEDNYDSFTPYVKLKCCSIEANFGNDLESKPFKYDISNHLILKEFYDNSYY
uniref:Uncharacterized protein n=1 Tax=Meloidogyne enterolobii TaxID=390850 RepID=A0A6V7X5A9_MELEN|nr:unnamed protein product [Meloidogyne enterolobii]